MQYGASLHIYDEHDLVYNILKNPGFRTKQIIPFITRYLKFHACWQLTRRSTSDAESFICRPMAVRSSNQAGQWQLKIAELKRHSLGGAIATRFVGLLYDVVLFVKRAAVVVYLDKDIAVEFRMPF